MHTTRNAIITPRSLAITYAPDSNIYAWAYYSGLVVLGVLLLVISSYITIPLIPVPITLQTYMVTVIGLTYGWALAGTTLTTYIFAGAIGIPVFAGGTAGMFFKLTTGGYIVGFLIASMVIGYLADNKGWDKHPVKAILAVYLGTIIIYMCGLPWLAYMVPSLDTVQKVLAVGLYPFIAGGIIKSVLAGITVPMLWKIMKKIAPE